MSKPQTLSSVRNALHILQTFTYDEPVIGVSEFSRRLSMNKSTVHRTLQTLLEEGFVRRTDDGRYALGLKLWELGSRMVHGLQLREVAHPIMEELRNETGETVHLAILDGAEVVYVHRLESRAGLTLFRRLGFRMPVHTTSSGKAILAFSPPEVVDAVIEAGLPPRGPATLTDPDAFRAALQQLRETGVIVSVDESEAGAVSVGAPVFDHTGGVVGGLSVVGPSQRFTPDNIERFTRLVAEAGRQITVGMGGQPVLFERERSDP